jgi:hypothetical protein
MSAPESYILPGDAVFPQGIVVRGDEFFASSFTQGTIYRGRLDQASADVFIAGGATLSRWHHGSLQSSTRRLAFAGAVRLATRLVPGRRRPPGATRPHSRRV